jgi:hypothetical protein
MVFFRATRSDAKSDVRKGKALPARRFESVRRHSLTLPHLSKPSRPRSHRDGYPRRNGQERRNRHPARRASRPATGDTAETAAFSCTCHAGGRTGKGTVPRAEFNQLAPRGPDLVAQDVDERRRRSNFRTLAVPLPLPGLVGQFFGLNRGAVTKDAVGKLAVTAPAFGRKASLPLSPFARLIAFGPHAHLCALFPTPLLVKALRIVGTLRPIHGAFDPPQFPPRLDYRRAELLENGLGMRHNRDSAGADIRTDNAPLRLPTQRRQAFLNKLDIPALTAADVSTDDTAILGFRFERLALPCASQIEDCWNHPSCDPHGAVAPDDGGPGFLAFKGIVAIPMPELGAPTLAKCILQDRIKGPRGRRLGNVTGKVVPDQHLSRHPWANFWSACPVNPNASNSRLNSFALALRSGDRGSPARFRRLRGLG